MDNGTLDSENSAVQESLALLFKAEAGVEYTNEEPVLPEEDFTLPPNGDELTTNILDNLEV